VRMCVCASQGSTTTYSYSYPNLSYSYTESLKVGMSEEVSRGPSGGTEQGADHPAT